MTKDKLIMRRLCMTKDIGLHGNLFGGHLLSWIDEAGAIYAMEIVNGNVVTRFMDKVDFIHPVRVGDTIHIMAKVRKHSTHSLTVHVYAINYKTGYTVADTDIVYVAVDETGRKLPLPKIDWETI